MTKALTSELQTPGTQQIAPQRQLCKQVIIHRERSTISSIPWRVGVPCLTRQMGILRCAKSSLDHCCSPSDGLGGEDFRLATRFQLELTGKVTYLNCQHSSLRTNGSTANDAAYRRHLRQGTRDPACGYLHHRLPRVHPHF